MPEFESKIIQHLYDRGASLDKRRLFVMYIPPKCAGTSIRKGTLKDRILMKKYHGDEYREAFLSLSEDEVMSMFRFTVVRNPFDRVLSAYIYLREANRRIVPEDTFSSFVQDNLALNGTGIDEHFVPLHDKLMLDGRFVFDFIGKLENIQEDWSKISERIDCPPKLSMLNTSRRKRDYRPYYDEVSKAVVEQIYQRELEDFDYEF